MIKFFINDKEVYANSGESILDVARRHDIYIPTMCYLTKVEPIASCRLCIVEAEGVDGFVLSCNTPPIEDIKIYTDSEELFRERANIMKLYNVNHPLECGVCDKSGECDLQNKTLEFKIDSQSFSAKEQKRNIESWDFIKYDENLCILCEKCVRVCNEVVGDNALKIQAGGYGSKIVRDYSRECSSCGECMSVCPVGALISKDFQYNSNVWELERIPASCSHCSLTCPLYYEVKKDSAIEKTQKRIYRVTNDSEFSSLCGAGRFGFDFDNRAVSRDKNELKSAVEAFKRADRVNFSSIITNEEALILQKLKERFGYKLINQDAKNFQKFLNAYSSTSGKSIYSASIEDIENSDAVIILGTYLSKDLPTLKYAINRASKLKRAEVIYMHPIDDSQISTIKTQFIKYEVGSEEGVISALANYLIDKSKLDDKLKSYFKELDIGYLSAESSVGEEEFELLVKKISNRENLSLIIGEDLINHKRAENIAKFVGLIERYTDFKTLITPSKTNTLGVSLICELDEQDSSSSNFSIGYNCDGDFTLNAFGDANLEMPALNQQEGTFTNIERRVVPTNVAIEFGGYSLNDIAKELGLFHKYTVDYTRELPQSKGFRGVEFDSLESFFTNQGEEVRGYSLEVKESKVDESLEKVEDLPEFNGVVVYRCEPTLQFNRFTNRCYQLSVDIPTLVGSEQFAKIAKIDDNDLIEIDLDGKKLKRVFKKDSNLKGTVGLNPTFDLSLSSDLLFSYRYQKVKITKELK